MKIRIVGFCTFLTCLISVQVKADMLSILRMIATNSGYSLDIQRGMQDSQTVMIEKQRQSLVVQQDIDKLMRQVNDHLSGRSEWGSFQFHDYQSYGGSANDWISVIKMADKGEGSGALGIMISKLANQFPLEKGKFNKGIRSSQQQKYYALKSQTILATRAASQLDYNKIQDQIAYQQMLKQNIENTTSLKAAVDLSNRIQIEGNLINLEILRQIALANQQQSITELATVNAASSNAKFLTKEME